VKLIPEVIPNEQENSYPIDFIGGEYENRTRVHGFAIRKILLISKGKIVNGLVSFRVTFQ
jgi:hypothetical protein